MPHLLLALRHACLMCFRRGSGVFLMNSLCFVWMFQSNLVCLISDTGSCHDMVNAAFRHVVVRLCSPVGLHSGRRPETRDSTVFRCQGRKVQKISCVSKLRHVCTCVRPGSLLVTLGNTASVPAPFLPPLSRIILAAAKVLAKTRKICQSCSYGLIAFVLRPAFRPCPDACQATLLRCAASKELMRRILHYKADNV